MRRGKAAISLIGVVLGAILAWGVYMGNTHPDLEPYRALFLAPREAPLGGDALSAQFLGNTNILLSDGETAILTDGFFSNPAMREVLFGTIEPRPGVIARALERAGIGRLAAVLVTHSHYDHVMDAPEVARLTGALLVGSESAANVARGWGLPQAQIRVVGPGERLRFGDFTVTMIRSRHFEFPASFLALRGEGTPSITAPLAPPVRAAAYREGGTFSVMVEHPLGNVLIQGSAGFVPGALDTPADVAFLSIGGLGSQTVEYQERYFRETVQAVGATRILPIHWDDLARPLQAPLRPPSRLMDLLVRSRAGMDFLIRRAGEDPARTVALMPLWDAIVLYHRPAPDGPGGR